MLEQIRAVSLSPVKHLPLLLFPSHSSLLSACTRLRARRAVGAQLLRRHPCLAPSLLFPFSAAANCTTAQAFSCRPSLQSTRTLHHPACFKGELRVIHGLLSRGGGSLAPPQLSTFFPLLSPPSPRSWPGLVFVSFSGGRASNLAGQSLHSAAIGPDYQLLTFFMRLS